MRILLVRHGESAANANKDLHASMADHDIPLSERGLLQATEAGKFLNAFLNERLRAEKDMGTFALEAFGMKSPLGDGLKLPKVRLWNSPYRRTRQTAKNILAQITPSEFNIDQRENSRLCEQQFGLFDGIPDDERHLHFPDEAAHYKKCEDHGGHYWARMPLGESRFDVGNRVYQFFGSVHRDSEKHGIDTIIVICHGITLRVFVQEWLHLSPEWVNAEPNPDNCWVRYLSQGEDDTHGRPGNWIDHGYIFTGEGQSGLWPKQRAPRHGHPCTGECNGAATWSSNGCGACGITEHENETWEQMSTQERSRIFADITLRDITPALKACGTCRFQEGCSKPEKRDNYCNEWAAS